MGVGELARAPKASCFQTVVSNHQAARRDASPHHGRVATCYERTGGRMRAAMERRPYRLGSRERPPFFLSVRSFRNCT